MPGNINRRSKAPIPLIRRRTPVLGSKSSRISNRQLTHKPIANAQAYDRMLKLTRIYEYVCLRIPSEKIADLMGLSLGYTHKLIQQLTDDFSVLVQNDEAKAIVADNIAKFNLMIQKAMSEISDPRNEEKGRIRIDAINAVADIVKKKADYEVLVGVVRKAPDDLRLRAH